MCHSRFLSAPRTDIAMITIRQAAPPSSAFSVFLTYLAMMLARQSVQPPSQFSAFTTPSGTNGAVINTTNIQRVDEEGTPTFRDVVIDSLDRNEAKGWAIDENDDCPMLNWDDDEAMRKYIVPAIDVPMLGDGLDPTRKSAAAQIWSISMFRASHETEVRSTGTMQEWTWVPHWITALTTAAGTAFRGCAGAGIQRAIAAVEAACNGARDWLSQQVEALALTVLALVLLVVAVMLQFSASSVDGVVFYTRKLAAAGLTVGLVILVWKGWRKYPWRTAVVAIIVSLVVASVVAERAEQQPRTGPLPMDAPARDFSYLRSSGSSF